MALCREFGPDNVGLARATPRESGRSHPLLHGRNPANMALREGPQADVREVIMDEFHYYATASAASPGRCRCCRCRKPGSC